MPILILESKQQIINTDHIITAYVSGREDPNKKSPTVVVHADVVGQNEPIVLARVKTFREAEQILSNLAAAISDLQGYTRATDIVHLTAGLRRNS